MRIKTVVLLSGLLALHVHSYAVVAYTPQTLRECIAAMGQMSEKSNHKKAFKELHAVVKENRMLTSDKVVSQGVVEAIEMMRSLDADYSEVIGYLEHYLKTLHNRGILLALDGNNAQKKSWSMGLISRSMCDQQDAYNLLCLSNELSDNLIVCGSEMNESVIHKIKFGADPALNFSPNSMTSAQSLTPTMIFGTTGVGSSLINGWALAPDGPQYPVTMQFIVPDDLAKYEPVSLELGLLIPNNGLDSGYAKFLVQSKYIRPTEVFNPDVVKWAHMDKSCDVKIIEAINSDNVRYMHVTIPLKHSDIKPGDFAVVAISRISPTNGKAEYAGDLALVSAVFKYASSNSWSLF